MISTYVIKLPSGATIEYFVTATIEKGEIGVRDSLGYPTEPDTPDEVIIERIEDETNVSISLDNFPPDIIEGMETSILNEYYL